MDLKWRALRGRHTFDPIVAASRVLVGGSNGLHALSRSGGDTAWQWYEGDDVFSPAVDGGTAYVTDRGGRIAAIDVDDGGVIWQRRVDGWLYTPALTGELAVTGGRAGTLYAFDRATGDVVWTRSLNQELVHRPVAVGGGVVVTTFRGTAARVSDRGDVQWEQTDPSPSFSPSIAGGLLVFGGMDGTWRARDPESGRLRWTVAMAGKLTLPARGGAGRVALASPDGEAAVVHAANGRVLRRWSIPGKPLGGPVHAGGGTWRVFYDQSGIISWIDSSDD